MEAFYFDVVLTPSKKRDTLGGRYLKRSCFSVTGLLIVTEHIVCVLAHDPLIFLSCPFPF